MDSWDGPLGALTCLPYTDSVHKNQSWLENYMWYVLNNISNYCGNLCFVYVNLINYLTVSGLVIHEREQRPYHI